MNQQLWTRREQAEYVVDRLTAFGVRINPCSRIGRMLRILRRREIVEPDGWHFAATYRNTSADEEDLPKLLKESSVVLDGKKHVRQVVRFGGRSNLHPDESWTFTIEMANYLSQDEKLSEGRHTLTLKFGGQEFGPVEFVWAPSGE
jgi:hypothetical protein